MNAAFDPEFLRVRPEHKKVNIYGVIKQYILQVGSPFSHPPNSVKALKGI